MAKLILVGLLCTLLVSVMGGEAWLPRSLPNGGDIILYKVSVCRKRRLNSDRRRCSEAALRKFFSCEWITKSRCCTREVVIHKRYSFLPQHSVYFLVSSLVPQKLGRRLRVFNLIYSLLDFIFTPFVSCSFFNPQKISSFGSFQTPSSCQMGIFACTVSR